MADFEDWDTDTDVDGGAGDDSAPQVRGGLLDPATFPSPWSSAADDGPALDRPAPEITGPLDTDVHAQVLQDILDAQAKLPPASDDLSIDRPAATITGPLMTDPHSDVFQNFMNAQAGLPPVKPNPETWSVNGQPYLAISAQTFDPALSTGVTSMPAPAESAAAQVGRSKIAVRDGNEERGGFISQSPSRVIATRGRSGVSDTGVTLGYQAPVGSTQIHGHIDGGEYASDGMVDSPLDNRGLGDAGSLWGANPASTATVSHGQVGWHVLDNGQLKFLYPPGSMDAFQVGKMQSNLDQEQGKFLRPK